MVLHEDKIGQTFLIPTNLLDLVPEGHPCFFVKNLVDQVDFDDIHSKFVGTAGMRAYSKRMLTRLVIMASIDGIRSSRKIAKLAEENLVYMYLTGNDKPSYRTIINFKNEYGSLIEEVLVLTIGVAREAGMVKLNDLAIDGTTIKANSSSSSIIKENDLELARKIIKEGKETDIIEDEKYGDKRGDEVPQDLTLKKKIKKLIKKVTTEEECVDDENIVFTKKEVEKLDHVHEELEKIKETHEIKDKEFSVSLTDPEARWMKNKKGKIEQSLNIQNIVDVEEGIILKSEVVQDPTDHHQLPRQIEGLKQILENDLKETNILADNGYNTSKSAKYLQDNDLNGFIPSRAQTSAKKNKIKKFSKAQFQYNIEKNTYTCPNNRILPYKKTYDINGKKRKVFYTKDCKNCQYKEECTPHSNYRIISHYSTSYQDLLSQKMDKEENQEIYKRRIIVERPFAHMKHNLNFTQASTRGIRKIQNEINLIAATHNIKRIHTFINNPQNQNTSNNQILTLN